MHSIQRVFLPPFFEDLTRLAVFRCKRIHTSYERNVQNLPEGKTSWWELKSSQTFDGVVILLDAADANLIEVWAGCSLGPDSGRLPPTNAEGRWTLRVDGAFQLCGVIAQGQVRSFLGKQPGNGVTYIDRIPSSRQRISLRPKDAQKKERGFREEFSGDRAAVTPGCYTPNSIHGRTIRALYRWLCAKGYTDLDNKAGLWDMHGFTPDGTAHLFELKTDADTTSVYTALGQLFLYELAAGLSRKIVVFPDSLHNRATWSAKLKQLNIGLIGYVENGDGYEFFEILL